MLPSLLYKSASFYKENYGVETKPEVGVIGTTASTAKLYLASI
ncbi:hypothetical protein N779_20825 [Vibrio coralliilyticus OCN008]|nr:hypothetical protein N779_20825 [Vibrio coralliilyticus OCN008]